MLRQLLAVALTVPLIGIPVHGQLQAGTDLEQALKVKTRVTRLGTGKQARVSIKLKDNTKLKGYIGEIGEERFTLIDSKRGTITPVQYAQVQEIKNTNHSAIYALAAGAAIIGSLMLLVSLSLRGS
jgi:hypothetical protein